MQPRYCIALFNGFGAFVGFLGQKEFVIVQIPVEALRFLDLNSARKRAGLYNRVLNKVVGNKKIGRAGIWDLVNQSEVV